MEKQLKSYGYYNVSIAASTGQKLLRTNDERAFIISQLQDLLTPRLLIDTPEYKQLASYVDLLAFSINAESVQLVMFSIDRSVVKDLAHHLSRRLIQYQDEHRSHYRIQLDERLVQTKKLRGAHHALTQSIALHRSHTDWEYDRYSSIGFYLHDRRGDWMRIWRLTSLYDNDSTKYLRLLFSA